MATRLRSGGESVSSVSLNAAQTHFAVGCGAQIEISRLHHDGLEFSTMGLKSSGRFTITDVAFSPNDDNYIAASATNGMVGVFDLTHVDSRLIGRAKWDSIEAPRSINKVGWHPTDGNVLISAGMDGTVRLFDLRDKTRKGTLYNTKAEATRDVQINPFDATMFAAISENGVLSIWDQRNNDIPVSKINAHTLSGLSVAWNPSFRGIIATGSRDKSVKIWDLGHTASNVKGGSVISSKPQLSTANNEELANKFGYRPVQVILTPSSVGRIRWRKSDKFADQLATVSTGADTQSGEILIWNVNNPNMPRCTLKAHGGEACTDFVWLDTPGAADGGGELHRSEKESSFMEIYQHILSVGKAGTILIHDLRNSFFPRSHISPSVTAISSQGHVAFQRGLVDRGDPLGLIANDDTRSAPALFQDNAEGFGLSSFPTRLDRPEPTIDGKDRDGRKLGSGQSEAPSPVPSGRGRPRAHPQGPTNNSGATASTLSSATSSSTVEGGGGDMKIGTGQVYCGLAQISDLVEAQEIRGVRGAEGGVFDPAVIALLARTYKLGDGSGREQARVACELNLGVALQSGLQCRASVWSVVLSLLSGTPDAPVAAPAKENDGSGPTEAEQDDVLALPSGQGAVHLPANLPFSTEILGFLLQELLDGGDCQHFVVVCEVLKGAGLLESACETAHITVLQRREAYLAYFDLLGRLKLFCSANDIIKVSSEDYISKITRQGVVMYTSCAKCGKELQEHNSGSPWCAKCNHCASTCSLCQQPVLKLMHWCPVCGHGGHRACLDAWFAKHEMCPTGCGHKCCQGGSDAGTTPAVKQPLTRAQRVLLLRQRIQKK